MLADGLGLRGLDELVGARDGRAAVVGRNGGHLLELQRTAARNRLVGQRRRRRAHGAQLVRFKRLLNDFGVFIRTQLAIVRDSNRTQQHVTHGRRVHYHIDELMKK